MSLGPALLFCPADRSDRYAKAAISADAVILDLEDAVAPLRKEYARECLVASRLDPAGIIVRINPVGTPDYQLDLEALAETHYRHLMLAKTERPSQIDELHGLGFSVTALCETAAGVQNAPKIAYHPAVAALMWGAEDLLASMGGRSSRLPTGNYRDVAREARSRILIAAHAAGKLAIDAVYLDIPDLDGLAKEAEDAAASGFAATACVHPTQIETVRSAYAPTDAEVVWATSVLEASHAQQGVFQLRGQMVDEPLLRQARTVLVKVREPDI
ncbi:CoA ester lyase [Diaminobutyricibacter tongyongensis]|uniref:CoA ester lyase n=1 Tax=Leifsonia tongyongensis TaxID=1268043 RepID=A0A6L9Y1V3_9MICO|nr:CoA ester lyase [Diaminobutyricibacter tongyongensis]NEN07669.1 CoA ester lyase [Diaminobutyricibacter tongyongensis]